MTIHDSFIEVSRERDAALRRLAEVEQALRTYGDHVRPCDYAMDRYRGGLVEVDCRPCSCGFAAVLDKGKHERPKVTVNIEHRRDNDGGFAAGYASGLRDGRRRR